MYLARFETDATKWLQGIIHFPKVVLPATQHHTDWLETIVLLMKGVLSLPGCRIALRVNAIVHTLSRTLLVVVPNENEISLRNCLASFTRLESLLENSADIPSTRDAHDAILRPFQLHRCHLRMPVYKVDTAWMACDFHLWPTLADLIVNVCQLSGHLSYQINVAPLTVSRESWLDIRRNAHLASDIPGAPSGLAAYQNQLIDHLSRASFMCEEFIAAEAIGTAILAETTLGKQFHKACSSYKFEEPNFEFLPTAYEEYLTTGLHTGMFREMANDEICGAAITEDELLSVLTWQPSQNHVAYITNTADQVTPAGLEPFSFDLPPDTCLIQILTESQNTMIDLRK